MFVWPDGSVTGSVHWGQLQALAASRADESVTEAGWAALDALLAGRVEGQAPSDSEPQDEGYESQKVDDLKALLKARDLPTSGNKAELVERLYEDDAAEDAEPDEVDDDTPEEE